MGDLASKGKHLWSINPGAFQAFGDCSKFGGSVHRACEPHPNPSLFCFSSKGSARLSFPSPLQMLAYGAHVGTPASWAPGCFPAPTPAGVSRALIQPDRVPIPALPADQRATSPPPGHQNSYEAEAGRRLRRRWLTRDRGLAGGALSWKVLRPPGSGRAGAKRGGGAGRRAAPGLARPLEPQLRPATAGRRAHPAPCPLPRGE